jgi:3-deoxy-D-manno-octulosonic-acid transferase
MVCYCPFDFSWAVNRAMERLRPDLLVLAELELWPNLICAARRRGAKVAVVNGRLSERSFRGYRRLLLMSRRVLAQLDLVAAQNEQYAERFRALGARPAAVHVTGSIKFDGAQTDRGNPATARLRQLAGITSDDIVWLAGSTQPVEEELALRTYLALRKEFPRLRLILVPRHPEHFATTGRMLDAAGVAWQRRTDLERIGSSPAARVLLVNVVGELGAWWGTADMAFVGGSLTDRGGQNMIEPAAYGAAVSFGPNTWNFRDVVEAMLAAEAAVVVLDGDQMSQFVRRALTDRTWAEAMGGRAQRLVRGQLGATQRTFDLLETLLPAEAPSAAAA